MDAKQFAWVALLRNGKIGLKIGYYGGYKELNGDSAEWQWTREGYEKEMSSRRKGIFKKIKEVGVDWKRTKAPAMKNTSVFEGTFANPSRTEYLSGTLVLNDGTEFYVMDDEYQIKDAFEMMTKVDEIKDYFQQHLTKAE